MQIWFYKRDCQIGDLVYFDGTTSDKANKAKTIVGIVFDFVSDDKKKRYCAALSSIGVDIWGLIPSSFPSLQLADNPGYSVFDIPGLDNKSYALTGPITDSNYLDGDGEFKSFPAYSDASEINLTVNNINYGPYQVGQSLPWGLVNTLTILKHRDLILTDSNVDLQIPVATSDKTEFSALKELINQVVNDNDGITAYKEFYYPAASLCYAYSPKVKDNEELIASFKPHNWFLPSVGELVRYSWRYGKTISAIYEKLRLSLGATMPFFHSSTERHERNNAIVGLANGINDNSKFTNYDILPVCVF